MNVERPPKIDPRDRVRMMLDLETISTRPDAAVVAIGFAVFTLRRGVFYSEAIYIDAVLARDFGHVDPETQAWWAAQDPAIRERVFGGTVKPEMACARFEEAVQFFEPQELWAKDPDFDAAILERLFLAVSEAMLGGDIAWPFDHRAGRSVRTVDMIATDILGWSKAPNFAGEHDPQVDAVVQAMRVVEILNAVRGLKGEEPMSASVLPTEPSNRTLVGL